MYKTYIESHIAKIEGLTVDLNNELKIEVIDQKGAGGANHRYDVTNFDTKTNPSNENQQGYVSSFSRLIIMFQNGTISENGLNGVTIEALLAICAHILEGFQSGKFACESNQIALNSINTALKALKSRTCKRIIQNLEGQHINHLE